MNGKGKYILFAVLAIIVIGLLAVMIFQYDLAGGSILATLAGGWAAFKSKIFGSNVNVEEKIAAIDQEHDVKREEWTRIKEEYDAKYNTLKARMDYLDVRSAQISSKIQSLDDYEREKLEEIRNISDQDRLNIINNL